MATSDTRNLDALAATSDDPFGVGNAEDWVGNADTPGTVAAWDTDQDWSDQSTKVAREVVAAGKYPAQTKSIQFTFSKSNRPMLDWVLTYLAEGKNRTGHFYTMLDDDMGKARTKRTVERIDPNFDFGRFNPVRVGSALAGRACVVKVELDTYDAGDGDGPQLTNPIRDIYPYEESDSFLS